jgi:diguanylate cyclase (GGDEF)-like protein/PAS domain S-box-containing protein
MTSIDELFHLMVERNTAGMVLTDRNGVILYINPRQLEASGYTLDEVIGKNPRIFRAGETAPEVYAAMWSAILSGHNWHGELTNRRKNGELCHELVHIAPIHDDEGNITHFFAIKEENVYAGLSHLLGGNLATIDPLTGLPNRAMMVAEIQSLLQATEKADEAFALMCLDLDAFHALNDRVGNLAADEVLSRIAVRLREAVRQSDAVARTGGNEFVLLLRSDPSEAMLEELSRRLITAIDTPVPLQGGHVTVTASIGIARYPLDGSDAESLLHCTQSAMSAAKSGGGDCVRFYTPSAEAQAHAFADLTSALRDVIARHELRLLYQPRINLKSGKISGLEALVRWQHPTEGLIEPGRFIPVAEETGLIVSLSEWVIGAVLAQQSRWRADGLAILPVGVNLSLRHFRSGDLPSVLTRLLATTGMPPECLELEISEGTMMRDPSQAFIMVDRIKALGVRLALDDFGTGLSSLSYLSRLNVDSIKIDKTFVRDITTNPVNASIVAAIIAMAHKLDRRVVAVGVESEGQAMQLRRHECDEIQGFYYAKPSPPEEIATLLVHGLSQQVRTEDAPSTEQTLLLVDDEPNILNALKRLLHREGYRILLATDGATALEVLAAHRVQVIVSDHRMPGMSGIELLSRVRDLYPHTRRIILSGYSDISLLTDAINRGAVWKFISKPWEDDALKAEIRHAFALRE